jgi:hypothetical protein
MKKTNFKTRILKALIENGIEYDQAAYLVNYQQKEALRLLNSILKQKKLLTTC